MVKIFFFYVKIIDNVLLCTFPTPPEKTSTPLNFLNPPPPKKKLSTPPPPENISTPLKKHQPSQIC